MRTESDILNGISFEELQAIGSRDPAYWIERVCTFGNPKGVIIKPFHRELIDLYLKHDRLCIMAPTGHGKSSVFGIGIPLWLAYFKTNQQMLIVSNTLDQSMGILERMKNEISDNELLRTLEPEDSKKTTWTKTEINLNGNNKIFCKPYTANIRSYHVNYCFCDEGAQYRDHSIFERWIITRVTAKGGKLVLSSTAMSAIDLPHKLMKNPVFVTKIYTALKSSQLQEKPEYFSHIYDDLKEGEPIFPELYSQEYLKEIESSQGTIRFKQEYMNDVFVIGEEALFPPAIVINCFDENLDFGLGEGNKIYIGVDFAFGTGDEADYFVITVIENNGIKNYIRKIEKYHGMPISAQIKRLEEINTIYRPVMFFVDETHYGQSMLQDMRSRRIPVTGCPFDMKSRNNYLINLRKMLEDVNIIIPRKGTNCSAITDDLYIQLTSFIQTKTPSESVTYKSTAVHDDIVMSLALAVSGVRSSLPMTTKCFY